MSEPELTIEVTSENYAADSEAWSAQVQSLLSELRAGGVGVRKEHRAEPGRRGGVDDVILALGSAGAFTAVVAIVQAFLAKDRSRKVEITAETKKGKVRVKADELSAEALRILFDQK